MTNASPDLPAVPSPQFRKTKQGKWAVMGPVETLQTALAGDGKVKVLKKSGDWSDFTVVSLGRPFDVEGVSMVYGYDDEGDPQQVGPSGEPTSGAAGGPARSSSRGPRGSSGGGSSNDSSDSADSSDGPPPRTPNAPPRDDSEPMPEYRGGPEDEWQEAF